MGTVNSLSNVDVIVFALYDLGGATSQIAHERLAYHAFELAPDRFSWTLPEYRKLPDKDIARVALNDASQDKGGRMVHGSVRSGYWRLTPAGVKWVTLNETRIARLLERKATQPAGRPNDVRRIVDKVRRHHVFSEFLADRLDEVPAAAFADLLECSPDASIKVVSSRFGVLQVAAEASGDEQLKSMIRGLRLRFADMIGEGGFDEAR